MKKGKKRKDWLIALILTAVVLGGTAGGVLYLESLLEKNKVPVSYDEPDTPPMGDEEVKPLNDEDLNPVIEDSEQKAEIKNFQNKKVIRSTMAIFLMRTKYWMKYSSC